VGNKRSFLHLIINGRNYFKKKNLLNNKKGQNGDKLTLIKEQVFNFQILKEKTFYSVSIKRSKSKKIEFQL
jgi:hypothetical protein